MLPQDVAKCSESERLIIFNACVDMVKLYIQLAYNHARDRKKRKVRQCLEVAYGYVGEAERCAPSDEHINNAFRDERTQQRLDYIFDFLSTKPVRKAANQDTDVAAE